MQCRYYSYNLAFRHPFTISRGTKTHQPTLVIELEINGLKGYGEAPAISYYHIPIEKMIADLENGRKAVEAFDFREPESHWEHLNRLFPDNSFLVCALDMAAWDLFGKIRNAPLYRLWGLDPAGGPMTDYTIGIDTIDRMVAKMKETPWPIYKVKLGVKEDIEILEALRAHTASTLRVDANAAWTLGEALEKIPRLAALGVEFIEQPLGRDEWEGMGRLYHQSPLPLIADEACVREEDVSICRDHFHGINIKLTKCGGITPARRMIAAARQTGLTCMVGSMNESTLGSAAIAQLLPLLDYADMDGPLLLKEDIATGISFDQGRVIRSAAPGLGVEYTGLFQKE